VNHIAAIGPGSAGAAAAEHFPEQEEILADRATVDTPYPDRFMISRHTPVGRFSEQGREDAE